MEAETGALAGIRIVDLTDERAIYGAKLLADLGAQVVRPEPPGGDPLRRRGPLTSADASLWHGFFASNRTFVTMEADQLTEMTASADVLLSCGGKFAGADVDLGALREANPALVVIDTTSLGKEGPWADFCAPDLIAGALGGAVATTGDVDTPPLKCFGELNFMVAGAYVAIAALAGLAAARRDGAGQQIDVSVHECLVSCLEQVLMFYWYCDRLMRPDMRVLPRRGALHWSNAYTVMNGLNGSIMITPTPDFDAQLAWMIEEDVHEDLIDEKYLDPENLLLRVERTMELLGGWVAQKDVEQLFFEAQDRHIPYGQVLPVEKLADNPQLHARNWYESYQVGGDNVQGPGAPYHFSATPWHIAPSRTIGTVDGATSAQSVLAELGWDQPREQQQWRAREAAGSDKRPLAGLRILDFTHVLAGPFATRVLGDMGADVVKVNSADRAIGANTPEHPYYLMWNRNKRALALNMKDAEDRETCRALCDQADVVIDNFSVGVLGRWGVGYEDVSKRNPGVIYVQMSGMGDGGPWSKFVTFAPTIHALSGLTHLTGVPGREDIGIGFSYNDHQAGLHGAVAMLAALMARQRTGRGQRIDVSQFEVGVNFAGPTLLDLYANDRAARPMGNRLPYDDVAPHNVYRCAPAEAAAIEEERWIAIACMTDEHWQALLTLMGNPKWSRDPALQSASGRVAASDTIDAHIAAWTREQDAYELMVRAQQAGVPAGVVQDGVDLLERDPQLRGFFEKLTDVHPQLGQTWVDHLPVRFGDTPCEEYIRTRALGEDNDAVLVDWLGARDEP